MRSVIGVVAAVLRVTAAVSRGFAGFKTRVLRRWELVVHRPCSGFPFRGFSLRIGRDEYRDGWISSGREAN